MKTGYDNFFKRAKENASRGARAPKPVRPAGTPQAQAASDSQVLAEKLRMQMRSKSKPQKKKQSIPWKLVGISFIGLVLALFGTENHEKLEKLIQRVEVSFLGSARAEASAAPAAPAASPSKEDKSEKPTLTDQPNKKEFSDEEINHFAKLNERKRELDAREEELNRLESELVLQRQELEKRLKSLESTRREISSVLEDRVKVDKEKVETLVQMYSTMKPQQAAKILETMDEDLAVEIVGRMKKKNAAEVMNLMKAEKAKVFSEKYAGYKKN